jgi:adenylate cyclase
LLVHPSAALAISDHAGKALAAVAAATVLDLANRWNVINTPCPSPQVRAASSPLQPSQQGPPSRTHRQQAAEARARFGSSLRAEDLYEARRFLQLSLSVDPNYARAYAMLTDTFATAWANALDSDFLNPAALDQAHLFASKAVQLDPNLPEGRAALGGVLAWKRQHEASLVEIDKAFALNPNYVEWLLGLGLVLAGQLRRAVDVVEASMRLDPFYPPLASSWVGLSYYMLKQYAQALPALRDCVSRAPNLRAGRCYLAATYAQLGQMEEARAEAAEVLRVQVNYTISGTQMRIMGFKSPEDGEHLIDGLRKAGLPE